MATGYITGILGAIGTLIGAIVGVFALRAKQRADATASKVSEVQIGLTALQQALARSDTERLQLIEDRDDLRDQVAQLRTDLTLLIAQVRSLGGVPIFGGVG